MSAIFHHILATWVPAKINATLAAYKADLQALVADYRDGLIPQWELDALWRSYTERTAVELERLVAKLEAKP